jgi:cell division protein FtsX
MSAVPASQRPPGAWMGLAAAVIAVVGLLCLALVVTTGLMGVVVSPVFTWAGLVLLPIAFALLVIVLIQQFTRRVRTS